MQTSTDAAVLLLKRWAEEKTAVACMYVLARGGRSTFRGSVAFGPDAWALSNDRFMVILPDLETAECDYGEPREAPAEIRIGATASFVCSLSFTWPSGDTCTLYEYRSEESGS